MSSVFNSTRNPDVSRNLEGRYPYFLREWENALQFYSDKVPGSMLSEDRPALVVFSREFPGIAIASVSGEGSSEKYSHEAERFAKKLNGTCYSPTFSAVFWKVSKRFSEKDLPEPSDTLLAGYSEEGAHSVLRKLDRALGEASERDFLPGKRGTFGEAYEFLKQALLGRESFPGRFQACEPRAAFAVVSSGRGPSLYRLEENLGLYGKMLAGTLSKEEQRTIDPYLIEGDLLEHIGQDALLANFHRTGRLPTHLITAPSSELALSLISEPLPDGAILALSDAREKYASWGKS